jgi:hypothetical protein
MPVQINWAQGFFRAWAVLAALWILFFGWQAYTTHSWGPWAQPDCLDQFAKWPDGTPFDDWERAGFTRWDPNRPVPKEDQSIKKIWDEAWQKVWHCEAAKPPTQRVARGLTENWSDLTSALQLILLPPLVVLIAGVIFGWIVKGFRKTVP